MGPLKKLRNKILLFTVALSLISAVVKAEDKVVNSSSKDVIKRIPSSEAKKYPKETDGQFEAQGFGKDYSKEPILLDEKQKEELKKKQDEENKKKAQDQEFKDSLKNLVNDKESKEDKKESDKSSDTEKADNKAPEVETAQDADLRKAKEALKAKAKKVEAKSENEIDYESDLVNKLDSEQTVIPVESEEELQNQLQLQRRVDIFYEGRVRFKNGASIWATEDAGAITPKLEITAPEFMDLNQEKIRFVVFSNYFSFINKWELRLYKMNRVFGQEDVAILKGDRSTLYNIDYEIDKKKFKDGDVLYYQLKVFQNDKVYDLVRPKQMTFTKQVLNQDLRVQDNNARSTTLMKIWGENAIEFQNIPILGSRVRLVGQNIPVNYNLLYRGQNIQVDQNGSFVIEEHFPVGDHKINIEITENDLSNLGQQKKTPEDIAKEKNAENKFIVPFNVKVTGDYFFYVAMADFRVGENRLSRKVVGLADDDNFGETFLDGRLAFYLKGRILGKYLVTAQMDTTEGPVENMFDGLHRKNAESLFRRLDPDRYYPVYGDNSTTTQDAASAGRLFVRIESDEAKLLWGNDNTDMTRTWLSQYNRTLYGAHFKYKSRVATKYAQRKTNIKAFASQPETLLGHNEFLGSGGLLYILRHNDVVQGSEKIRLETRDRDTGLPTGSVILKPFVDYDFDYLAGRIVLAQPLATFDMQGNTQIIDNNTVGGNLYYLIADYEYNATGSNLDKTTLGASGEHWLNDYISVGGTYVDENGAAGNYNLKGVDASLRVGKDSYVKLERAETQNVQTADNFLSDDGGLSFVQKPQTVLAAGEAAQAWVLDSQLHLTDLLNTKDDAILSTWYRDFEAGFSTARFQASNDLVEYGLNLDYRFMDRNIFKTKHSSIEEDGVRKDDMFLVSLGREFSTGSTLSIEYRQDKIQNLASSLSGRGEVVGALINQRVTPAINLYAKAQTSLKEEGIYTSNDRWALGTKFRMSAAWDGLAEYSNGDRGEGSVAGLGYNVDATYKIYGNFDKSVDTTTGLRSNGFTLGQRKRMDGGFNLTSENGFETVGDNAGVRELYGLDYNINRLLTAGVSVQFGDLENRLTGELTSKDAVSANVTYNLSQKLLASTKVSFVNQRGAVNLDQFLVTNSLRFRTSVAHEWSLKADYSFSEDPNFAEPLARYFEGNIGHAFRPVTNNRLNTFFRYTFLYDLDSQAQVNSRNDQRVSVVDGQLSYDFTKRWEIGGRLAQKIGSERLTRGTGPWIDATLTFAQIRARYHILKKWDGVFELRAVNVKENQDLQAGSLIGIDYNIGDHLRLGAGFNFTRFNDDLTNFNYDNYGWFINLVGKM